MLPVTDTANGSRAPGGLTVNVSVATMCLIWGSTWLVIREGLRDLPPMTSLAVRFTVAALLFVLIAPYLRRKEGGGSPPLWLTLFMGTVDLAVPYGVVYWAETLIPSGLAAVLWAVFPMFVAILAHLFLPGEKLSVTHWLGFLLAFGGVGLLFLTDLRALGPDAIGMGLFYMLSPFAAAVGVLVIKRHARDVSSVVLNRNGMVVAAASAWLAVLLLERGAEVRWTGFAVFSVAYLSVVGTVITFGLFYWLMRYAPAFKLALISYVIPVVALVLGVVLGAEEFGVHTLVGTALILVGVGLARRSTS